MSDPLQISAKATSIELIPTRSIRWSDESSVRRLVSELSSRGFRRVAAFDSQVFPALRVGVLWNPVSSCYVAILDDEVLGTWSEGFSVLGPGSRSGTDEVSHPRASLPVDRIRSVLEALLSDLFSRRRERQVAQVVCSTRDSVEEALPDSLLQAVWEGNVTHVEALLTSGAAVDELSPRPPLERIPDMETLGRIVGDAGYRSGEGAVFSQSLAEWFPYREERRQGTTPLRLAAELGDSEIVQLLLDAGASVDANGSGGETALLLAVRAGWFEIVDRLLRAGADPRAAAEDGLEPIILAAQAGNCSLVDLLTPHVSQQESAQAAVLLEGAQLVGERKNVRLEVRRLLRAAEWGRLEVVRRLLEKGIDPDASEETEPALQVSPLMLAVQGGHTRVVQLLIEAGADVCRVAEGRSVLVRALDPVVGAGIGAAGVVQLLIEAGARMSSEEEAKHQPVSSATGTFAQDCGASPRLGPSACGRALSSEQAFGCER